MKTKTDRRQFLTQVGGAVAAGAAMMVMPACEIAGFSPDDDFGMHGPVRVNHALLELPASPAAMNLLTPYDDGRLFMRRWAIAHVVRGPRDQVVVLFVDTETGGHAELEVFARDPGMQPIAHTELYGVYVDNDGRGDVPTPRHLRQLAERLAEIIAPNEQQVQLDWQLPTMRQATSVSYPELRQGEQGSADEDHGCPPG